MCMLSERLQILVSPEQRRRLEEEARAAQTSVARLIRDAIDARYSAPDRGSRLNAVAAIRQMAAPFVPAAELDRLAESERDHDEDVMLSQIRR
jgi:hypothetical protein